MTTHGPALRLLVLACLAGSLSCTLEHESPTDPLVRDRDASTSGATSDADEPEDPPNDDSPPATSEDDAVSDDDSDAGGGTAAGAEAGVGGSSDSGAEPSLDGEASLSCAPKVDGCNPVKNEGCLAELGMHCAVDPLAFTLAGYCIFSATDDSGTGCLNTFVTESCAPKSSCFEGQCRQLCFCNSDCDPGECCAEPLGSLGFKTCSKC